MALSYLPVGWQLITMFRQAAVRLRGLGIVSHYWWQRRDQDAVFKDR